MKHEVFGDIQYEYFWYRIMEIEIWGHKYNIRLSIDSDGKSDFEEVQIEAFKKFMLRKNYLIKLGEEALFKYYQEVNSDCRESLGLESADDMAPIIGNINEMSRVAVPTDLIVKETYGQDERKIGILFTATWEPEHGVAIKYINEEVNEVGLQDIVL